MDVGLLLLSTLSFAAPLVLAAMGGFFSERSGIINIGLEGMMLLAAALGAIVGLKTGSVAIGVGAAIGGGLLMSLLHYALTQIYQIDHIVSGMAVNAGAYGISNFLDRRYTDPNFHGELPRLPTSVLLAVALIAPFLIYWAYHRTRAGLRLNAVGNSPEKARQMGVSPLRVRFFALVLTGVCCGLAGLLVVTSAGSYVDNITAGRGYIALAALILGGWRPIPALIACLAFGFFEALQLQLQGTALMGATLPPEFWKALPYLCTLVAMAGFLGHNRPPSGLGRA